MATNRDTSDTTGVGQDPAADPDAEPSYQPGGSAEPNPDPENPGGTAATHHPPAEA